MSDQAPASLGAQIWDGVGKGPGVVIILGVVYALVIWGVGPIKPQGQIELDAQKAAIVRLESRAAVAETRLDALPRASDFADWTAHLSRLDAVFEAQRDKITASGYDVKDLQNKYGALTSTARK